jgi:LacI family transcriptional regulator
MAKTTKRRPTLADVARLAGVSLGSASHALSMPQQVKPSTLEKVERAVSELGYIRDGAARALASRRTHTIAAIYPTLNNPIFAHSTEAMQRMLWELGYHLLIVSHEYHADDAPAVIRSAVERGVDGLILVGSDYGDDVFELLHQRRLPYVLTWATDDTTYPHCVGISNFQAMYDLARIVVEYGHQAIAVCGGDTKNNERARARRQGVMAALTERGLGIRNEWVVEAPFSYQGGRDAFRQLWQQDHKPTAILFGNDLQAIGALHEARGMGVQVPRDVSILGFDNIEEGAFIQPALSTMHVPAREIGRLAAERLVTLIESESEGQAIQLQHKAVLRESLGPPPVSTLST